MSAVEERLEKMEKEIHQLKARIRQLEAFTHPVAPTLVPSVDPYISLPFIITCGSPIPGVLTHNGVKEN
jgi:hypothetical protein